MLCLSQSVGYAVQALAVLGTSESSTCLIRDIAEKAQVPPAYLAKLVKRLSDAEIVVSKRGIKGGTWLKRKPEEITLLEISEAIDGKKWINRCLLGLTECSDERACPTHKFWKTVRESIQKSLEDTTLADVISFQSANNQQFSAAEKKKGAAEKAKTAKTTKKPEPVVVTKRGAGSASKEIKESKESAKESRIQMAKTVAGSNKPTTSKTAGTKGSAKRR
ncbi:MAG: Rrf2 family transcriptional regulator [Chthoniobacterales bacterium]|nr:Rrf2 family transcriptional regulator [Chthoniobacterales bacterium]